MGEPAGNLEVARRYLQAIERGATSLKPRRNRARQRGYVTPDL